MSFRCIGIVILAAIVGAHAQRFIPDSRWGQATTVINNTLLIHGGKKDLTSSYSYSSAPNTAELLSLDLSSSFSLSSPPWTVLNITNAPSVAFHTLTAYSGHQLLLFGGDPGPSLALSTQNDSAAILDIATGATGTWTVPSDGWASEPMRRQYHSATSYNSQVVIIGGEKVDGSDYGFKESYLFSPTPSFSQLPDMNENPGAPDFVGHAVLTLPNGTLLLFGGYSHTSHTLQSLKTIYTLDIASQTWGVVETTAEPTPTPSTTPPPPPPPPQNITTSTDAPPSSESWSAPAPAPSNDTTPYDGDGIPTRRRNFAAVLVGTDRVLIHGGADAGLQTACDDAWILNLGSSQWKELPTLGQALGGRWGHTAVASGKLVLFAFGYTGSGPASNGLVLYDTSSDSLLASFSPPSTTAPPNTNSPPASGNTTTHGGPDPNTSTTGIGNGDPNPLDPTQDGNQGQGENKTPAIIGGLFGGLVAAALVIVTVVLYRRRREKGRGYGRRSGTDDSEKAVMMLGGFEAAPPGRGLFNRLFHLQPTPGYYQRPGRERFDILAEEDASYAAIGNGARPRAYRSGTGGSGSTYGASGAGTGYFGRWSYLGGAVNASVGSLRSAFGLAPVPSPGRDPSNKDEYLDLGSSPPRRSINASAGTRPPSAWRRGSSSYTTANRVDPFGDEHEVEEAGVEEEYQRAMMMQHEALRRAASSGADEYSALVFDSGRRGVPLEPVPSISTEPSSNSHENLGVHDERIGTTDTTHITSLRTPPVVDNAMLAPRVYSPPPIQNHQYSDNNTHSALQRTTSGGSRIGASLTRALSAVSSLFSGPPPPYGVTNRVRRVSGAGANKGARPNAGYEYMDLRDPNPPPPMLGLGLVPINEGHTPRRTGSSVEFDSTGTRHVGKPPLVLRAIHGKSLSSLRTANSEALERLGTGHWDVVQRDGTGSSRRTEGSNATLGTGSDVTDLGGGGGGWRDVVGDREPVESPGGMDDAYEHGPFWNDYASRGAASGPAGPRPIPPPKVTTLVERMEALGKSREVTLPLQGRSAGSSQALYGLVPKATLYVANPGKKPTDASFVYYPIGRCEMQIVMAKFSWIRNEGLSPDLGPPKPLILQLMSEKYKNSRTTARVDQQAINYSQAFTSSYASSVAPVDKQEDRESLYTYTSQMDAQTFVRRIGERSYNALSDVYFLPTDEDEWVRLNKQHVAFFVAMGGLYAAPDVVRAILAPREGETQRILDLGCGTGVWASEMGKEFPHCEVVGVDLAPVPLETMDLPPNCRFEIDDVNLGLAHFKGHFDVVHARLMASGLKDFRKTMQDVEECLKPGGIVLWFEVDFDMYTADQHIRMPSATAEDGSGSWLQRIVYEIRRGAVSAGGSDLYAMHEALDKGLWEQPLLDPATCKTASLYLPIGPWPKVEGDEHLMQQMRYIGSLIRQDLMSAYRANHATIKRSGVSEELLQEWSNKTDEEMMSLSKPMWLRMRLAWGRRRASEGSPAPPLPPLPADGRDSPTSHMSPYPHFFTYDTQEQSLYEAGLRNRDLPIPPLQNNLD